MTPSMHKAMRLIQSSGNRLRCETWMQEVPAATRAALYRRNLVRITATRHGKQRFVVGR